MKNIRLFVSIGMLALAAFVMQACEFSSANMSGLKVTKEKDGTADASQFKTGETIHAKADIKNNPGKVKVKLYLVVEDAKGLKKGETLKGSEVSVDIPGDGYATYNLPVSPALPGGKYKLNADMLNEAGEKKDGKSADITITQEAPPAPESETDSDSNSDSDTAP